MTAVGALVLAALALATALTVQWRTPTTLEHAWRDSTAYLELNWPFASAVFAVAVFVVGTAFTGIAATDNPTWWMVMNLVAYLIHQVEEHSLNWHAPPEGDGGDPWRQGFKQLIAKLFSPAASSDRNLLLVNVGFVWVPYALSVSLAGNAWVDHKAAAAIRKRDGNADRDNGAPPCTWCVPGVRTRRTMAQLRALHLPGAVCLGLSVANGLSHVGASLAVLHHYGAGLLTAPCLLLVGVLGLLRLRRERLLSGWQVPACVLAGAAAHAPILLLFHFAG